MRYIVAADRNRVIDAGDPDMPNIGPRFTTAEAQIIAFALNAVAAGGRLRGELDAKHWHEYDGPTEGVAP